MSAVCPACGVPVVPGYVKCPKCHATLPAYASGRVAKLVEGGTVVPDRSFPVFAILVPIAIVLVILVVFGLRGGGGDDEAPADAAPIEAVRPTQGNVEWHPPTAQLPAQPPPQTAPDPAIAMGDLDRNLRKQRLWSTVERNGSRIDVRSTKCGEAAMASTIDASAAALREGGLTQLRCLAQSGAVVFERNL